MTLHPIPLNFLIYEENFIFFFISAHDPPRTVLAQADLQKYCGSSLPGLESTRTQCTSISIGCLAHKCSSRLPTAIIADLNQRCSFAYLLTTAVAFLTPWYSSSLPDPQEQLLFLHLSSFLQSGVSWHSHFSVVQKPFLQQQFSGLPLQQDSNQYHQMPIFRHPFFGKQWFSLKYGLAAPSNFWSYV